MLPSSPVGGVRYVAPMAEFVLVAGARLGGWAWDEVVPELRAAGHGTHALTLSGLAERKDVPVGPRTHVEDIVGEIDGRGLREVVLVGHSYSGVPVAQAAGLIGDRLSRMVMVDASVPREGESFLSGWPSDHVREAVAAAGGVWPVPGAEEFAGQGMSDEQIARMLLHATPHPGASLTAPASLARPLADLPTTYIKCLLDGDEPPPVVTSLLDGRNWELVNMPTGHWPMFSQPRELARILLASVEES